MCVSGYNWGAINTYDVVDFMLKLGCMNLFVLKKRFQSSDHLAKDSRPCCSCWVS